MRKIICLTVCSLGTTVLSGCSVTLPYNLRQSLDEVTVTSIVPNEKMRPGITVQMPLQDPLSYFAGHNAVGGSIYWTFPFNDAFEKDIHEYAHTKFPNSTDQANPSANSTVIDVEVSTVTATYNSAADSFASDLRMTVYVKKENKSLPAKTIEISNEAPKLGKAIEGNINKAIILLDKYLVAVGF